MLTLRISSTTLSAACLEMGKPFSFTPLHLQSHRSLIANLQEAVSTTPIFKERNPKEAVQVLVVGNATPIPLSEFQEEDCDAFYNYCFKPMVPHRVFYDVVPTANLMLVMGSNKGNRVFPNWERNLALAVKLQAQLEQTHQGLCKPINLVTSRYNQDLCTGALLVEVGTAGNTHAEALAAAEHLAAGILALENGANH